MQKEEKFLTTQEKKLRNITFNNVIPFTSNELVKNLLSFEFSTTEDELLKYSLLNSIPLKEGPNFSLHLT